MPILDDHPGEVKDQEVESRPTPGLFKKDTDATDYLLLIGPELYKVERYTSSTMRELYLSDGKPINLPWFEQAPN